MRSLVALGLPIALAAASLVDLTEYEWSYKPDKTADWYKQHGQSVPETAPELTIVEDNRSYVVKLQCLGCPFRVRKIGEVVETWQEPPQDNSLLLNFTIDDAESTLLINGDTMIPLASRPPATTAFQIPTNTSVETMRKMTGMHMLDHEAWKLGTKYGQFELQYEHTQLATEQSGEEWLQFDVLGVHERGAHNPGSYYLTQEGQRMVQLLLSRRIRDDRETLVIKDVEVVERKARAQPIKMPCGRYAMIQTQYNPLEWDYYGKLGTFSRTWHRITWGTLEFVDRNGFILIVAVVMLGLARLVRWRIKRSKEQAGARVKEDAEAALLAPEYDDAPPDYADVPQGEEPKEDGQ